MLNKVREYLSRNDLIHPGEHVLIGLSGGADSVALLRVLLDLSEELSLKITAAHFHHGIRGEEADGDEAFAKELCGKWNVPCYAERADIPALAKEQKMPLEQAAREARYAFLRRVKAECGAGVIAVAHHLQDQAESVLMHLIRGSGLTGLGGMRPIRGGRVTVAGQDVTGKTPGQIRSLGLAHIPEDRLATGVSGKSSVEDNLLTGKQRTREFSLLGVHQKRGAIHEYARKLFERFDIRGAGVSTAAGSLSGGNMQKVVIAREFSLGANVLVISQPTRGVDIGAIEFIHRSMIEKRNAGCAILLVSADLDEVFRLSDRIITLYEGRVTGHFKAGEIEKADIGYYMTGGVEKEADA